MYLTIFKRRSFVILELNAYAPTLELKDTDGKDVSLYRGFIVTDEDTVSLVPALKASDKDEIGGASKSPRPCQ